MQTTALQKQCTFNSKMKLGTKKLGRFEHVNFVQAIGLYFADDQGRGALTGWIVAYRSVQS